MTRKLNFSKHIRKIYLFFLACIMIISLSGCNSSNRRSTGDLKLDENYVSASNYSLTVGELYDELRYNATDYLVNQTYKIIYADEIQAIKDDIEGNKEKLNEYVLNGIYGTSDEDEIKDLDSKTKTKKIQTYIDTMYKAGFVITEDNIDNNEFASVYEYYYLDVAKYNAAKAIVEKEFKKDADGKISIDQITDDSFFTKDEVKDWYEDNYTNKGDVTAILVRFINSDEASNVLKTFGIKAYNGEWYQIQLSESKCDTKLKYDDYYDDYKIDTNNDAPIAKIGNGNATILKIYAEIYNYIYTYRTQIVLDSSLSINTVDYKGKNFLKYYYYIKAIIDADNKLSEEEKSTEYNNLVEKLTTNYSDTLVMTNEKLNTYNSSLATYVYETLETEADEDETYYNQYSTSAKSYGDFYYLVFKINQTEDEKFYEEDEDDSDEFTITNLDLLNTIIEEMIENKVSDSYVTEKFEERIKKAKLSIYDSIIELQFTCTSDSKLKDKYTKTRKSSKNNIAQVKYNGKKTNITVKELYDYLEPLYGPQTATNLLFKKYIKTTDYYKDLEDKYDQYKESIETMLYYFTNDSYSSYGYPSSIGKYNFMLMYFKTANIDKAIKDSMMVSDALSDFYLDYKDRFEGNTFYTNLKDYVEGKMKGYYSLTATSINAFYDMDEDGVADKISDQALIDLAEELLNEVQKYIKNSHEDYATALTSLISEYNSSTRIENENPTSPETKWAKYRRAGLYINQTSLDAITDSTTTAEENVQARIKELFADEKFMNPDYGFISSQLDKEILVTKNGYSILLITAGATVSNTKYEDKDGLYNKVPVIENDKTIYLDFTNGFDTIYPSEDQIKAYVLDYLTNSDVYVLPESVTTTLDTYLLPLINRYTSSASQYLLIENELGTLTFVNNDSAVNPTSNEAFNSQYTRDSFLTKYIEILKNTADDYNDTVYPGWWTNMYQK